MTTRLGVDISVGRTEWASVSGDAAGSATTGSFPSVVGALADGSLVVGDVVASSPPGTLVQSAQGFLAQLGQSEPIMLGGTPYGPESLVARLIAEAVAQSRAVHPDAPAAVAVVHDDGLDEFRIGLLTEAGRLAGVAPSDLVLVARSTAGDAAGAARIAWSERPDAGGAGGGASVVAGGAAAVGGAAAAAAVAGAFGDGIAAASAAAPGIAGPAGVSLAPAGPVGAPLSPVAGPTGAPLAPTAGPAGAPLTPPAGPAGTPLAPAGGPTGSPLAPTAGPTGTPLAPSAGPAGTPLSPPSAPAVPAGRVPRAPRVPTLGVVAGVVAVVAVVVGVVVVANSGSDTPAGAKPPAGETTTVGTGSGGGGSDTSVSGDPGATIDVSSLLGAWRSSCQPYLAGDGASSQDYVLTSPAPGQLDFTLNGIENTTTDCTDDGTVSITVVYPLTVVTTGDVGGVTAYSFQARGETTCDDGGAGACGLALGAAALPPTGIAFALDAAGNLLLSDPAVPIGGDGLPTAWMQEPTQRRG